MKPLHAYRRTQRSQASSCLASGPATALLHGLAVGEWALLDGSLATLALASVVSVGGPLAELPLLYLHCWHYLAPNVFPLEAAGLFERGSTDGAWAGLDLLTGPCYFAVCTDSNALYAWFRRGADGDAESELLSTSL
mmetsp:Transcript_27804/g.68557  ORF Transcript_27804/g.68557 Transcript_27804/m.68557 type:complete len:137 (+) Transcript_27804:611-1021(+)